MTVKQLKSAMASKDPGKRVTALRHFAATTFGVDALPTLRRALSDNYVDCVITAANCIAKLGPAALESPAADTLLKLGDDQADLTSQLMLAGAKVWAYSDYSNCYSACLNALVKIGTDPEFIVEFIHNHIGLSSQDDFVASAEALAAIGTDDAIDLLERGLAFWRPELNKANTKKVEKLLAATK